MRNTALLLLILCLTALLSACQAGMLADETEIRIRFTKGTDSRPQLLKDYEAYNDNFIFWPDNVKEDGNLTGEGGNYTYWWDHRSDTDDGMVRESYCAIPEKLLSKMSTRNLVRTCYIYPYGNMIWASNDPRQAIFFYLSHFNGLQELQSRKSAPAELLHLYQELRYPKKSVSFRTPLDYTEYLDESHSFSGLNYLTLILETAVDYDCFTSSQVKELAAEVRNKIADVNDDPNGLYSWHTAAWPHVLGAMMVYHYDTGLTDKDIDMMKAFIGVKSSFPGTPMAIIEENGQYAPGDLIKEDIAIILAGLDRLAK